MERYQSAGRVRSLQSSRVTGESANDILWITYRWMSLGLAVTGLVAWFVAQSSGAMELIANNRGLMLGLMVAQFGLVIAFSTMVQRVSTATAAAMFFSYAALTGVTFSVLFLVFTASSIASTFFVTAGTFAGLSVFGSVTRRDLSAVGRFAFFAVIGLVLSSIVNIWLQSSALMWISTFGGILVFGALTAYDTQQLKQMYAQAGNRGNLALMGALRLYLDFINMFLYMLRLFGDRR